MKLILTVGAIFAIAITAFLGWETAGFSRLFRMAAI
jgi:hypothetical protein